MWFVMINVRLVKQVLTTVLHALPIVLFPTIIKTNALIFVLISSTQTPSKNVYPAKLSILGAKIVQHLLSVSHAMQAMCCWKITVLILFLKAISIFQGWLCPAKGTVKLVQSLLPTVLLVKL